MQVTLEKRHPIAAPPTSAWTVLQDIHAVAECMPGASISEQLSDNAYKGQVKVKIGPASAIFNGQIDITGLDAERRELKLLGKGKDTRGSSTASMDLTALIEAAEGGHCALVGSSQVKLTGKMAAFGGRMINQVSDQILMQFFTNFSNRVMALGEGAAAVEAAQKVAEQPEELNALALVWQMIVDFFRRLFGKKAPER